MDTRELTPNELEQVSGGWEYDGHIDWLKGVTIQCPYCGADDPETVKFICKRQSLRAFFECSQCKRTIEYLHTAGGKVIVKE